MTSGFNGYILAGGRSSRMGSDKGLLQLGETTLIGHVIRSIEETVSNLFIISSNPGHRNYDLTLIPDIIAGKGPAGGILTALEHSSVPFNFIVSCDTPFIRPQTITILMQKHGEFDITLPEVNGYPEPLCGIYSTSCAVKWRDVMTGGKLKLTDLISCFRYQLVPLTELNGGDKDEFFNINNVEDYTKALNKFHQ